MKEFLQALAISLAFVLGGYFVFGGLTPSNSEDTMEGMDMSSESMGSMPGMNH